MNNNPPWMMAPLDEWSIVAMSHYHINEERFLSVTMSKDNIRIREEGKDDEYLWNRLWYKAHKIAEDN